jgi:hypothetical protein
MSASHYRGATIHADRAGKQQECTKVSPSLVHGAHFPESLLCQDC